MTMAEAYSKDLSEMCSYLANAFVSKMHMFAWVLMENCIVMRHKDIPC